MGSVADVGARLGRASRLSGVGLTTSRESFSRKFGVDGGCGREPGVPTSVFVPCAFNARFQAIGSFFGLLKGDVECGLVVYSPIGARCGCGCGLTTCFCVCRGRSVAATGTFLDASVWVAPKMRLNLGREDRSIAGGVLGGTGNWGVPGLDNRGVCLNCVLVVGSRVCLNGGLVAAMWTAVGTLPGGGVDGPTGEFWGDFAGRSL
jgi:hypothetical protein